MIDLLNADDISGASLGDLRSASHIAMTKLPDNTLELLHRAKVESNLRSEKILACELIEEFTAPMCGHFDRPVYELAFDLKWYEKENELYLTRKWINGFNGGVYFIYDQNHNLLYIGSSFTGDLGKRIWTSSNQKDGAFVDVVLFERQWSHYALAFEALAISRLCKIFPLRNKNLTNIWIEPYPPWKTLWESRTREKGATPETNGEH